jgi:hypothetical protein
MRGVVDRTLGNLRIWSGDDGRGWLAGGEDFIASKEFRRKSERHTNEHAATGL